MVFPVEPPDLTTDTAAEYKVKIDSSIRGLADVVTAFAPSQNDPVGMSVVVNQGYLFDGSLIGPLEVTGIGAPSTGQRIDIIYLDINQRTLTRITGAESASPTTAATPPAIPRGKLPICQILFVPTDTFISNAMLTDIRPVYDGGLIYTESGFTFVTDPEGIYRIAISGSFDKQIRLRMHTADGTSKIQFRNSSDAVVGDIDGLGNLRMAGTITPSFSF